MVGWQDIRRCLGPVVRAARATARDLRAEMLDRLPAWPPRLGRSPLPQQADEGAVRCSHASGSYRARRITVELEAPDGCTVALTTDGSSPTAERDTGCGSVRLTLDALGRTVRGYLAGHRALMFMPVDPNQYMLDDPHLPSGRVLRAAAVRDGELVGKPIERVFFLGASFGARFPGCLVMSLVVDRDDLLDYERGILATGAAYDAWLSTPEAKESLERNKPWLYEGNFTQPGRDWERPCLLQLYDRGPTPLAEVPAGVRIGGKTSRVERQRPFAIFLRKEYGTDCLDQQLFGDAADIDALRLRTGGQGAMWLKFKDVLLQELAEGRRFVTAQSRLAVLFLNGEYWGPYILSEWVGSRMLQARLGVAQDQVVLMLEEQLEEGLPGDEALYEQLMAFAERDLSDERAWEEFCRVMDVRSFADHAATRIYVGCGDWKPCENDMLWRTRDASYNDGRWQYVLFDLDFSAGAFEIEPTDATADHFGQALREHPLFAAAMRNREFRRLFLDALRSIGSTCYAPECVEEGLRRHERAWRPLLDDFHRRYGDTSILWELGLASTRDFFRKRYDVIVPIVEAWCAREDAR